MALITGTAWGLAARNFVPRPHGAPVARAHGFRAWKDFEYGGAASIADTLGVIDPDGTPERPIARRVSLLDRRSLKIVRSTVADAYTGAYAFHYLRPDVAFMVLADDYTDTYNAVVSDWVYAR